MTKPWILAIALAVGIASTAWADMRAVPPPPGVLPQDAAALAALHRRHATIVRRTERSCAHQYGWHGGINFRACVVGGVENAVLLSQDPQLQAYHRSLPFPLRYQQRVGYGPEPWSIR